MMVELMSIGMVVELMRIGMVIELKSIDTMVIDSKMASGHVASVLLNLEFKGVIKLLPGKVYRLI